MADDQRRRVWVTECRMKAGWIPQTSRGVTRAKPTEPAPPSCRVEEYAPIHLARRALELAEKALSPELACAAKLSAELAALRAEVDGVDRASR